VEGDQLSIRDLGSTNGTRLNGQLITAWRTLRDGDEIQLGDLPLVVQLLE
jgi:pSer/pThr/pTyr-binding forkhead associated (FHA) protein